MMKQNTENKRLTEEGSNKLRKITTNWEKGVRNWEGKQQT